jgi:PKHD-type hydroxylase
MLEKRGRPAPPLAGGGAGFWPRYRANVAIMSRDGAFPSHYRRPMLLSEIPPEALPFVSWPGAFTAQEVDEIARIGDRLVTAKATLAGVSDTVQYDSVRITETAWMLKTAETDWLWAKMAEIVRQLNERVFQFALTGFVEPFQYTVYRAEQGSHYQWHADHGAKTPSPRKLSLSVQLTDGAAYQGCDLQTRIGKDPLATPRERGTVIAFPSYVLHRVTPITAGTRKSLVAWAVGPRFR